MNVYQLIGSVLTIIGAICILVGGYQQSISDGKFQNTVVEQVKEQAEINTPRIVGLKIVGQYPDLRVVVKNTGNKPAMKVKLIYSEKSNPSAFSSNNISGLNEVPNGTEFEMPLNLFSGIDRLLELPNSDKDFVVNLKNTIDKYNSGQSVLIPRFYFEFFSDNKKCESELYYLIVSKENGIVYFGKEENHEQKKGS